MLNVAQLRQAILIIISTPASKTTPAQAAADWASAYDAYARGATDVSGDKVLSVNRAGFQSALRFKNQGGTAAGAASEFERGFISYWTGAQFAVAIPVPPVTPCPSVPPSPPWLREFTSVVVAATPGLAGLLTPIFQDNASQDLPGRAGRLANAFHTATTTNVRVMITGITTPPPPGGLPVTNLCTIF